MKIPLKKSEFRKISEREKKRGVFQRNVPENPHAFSIVLNQCFRNFINGSVKDVDEVRFPADKGGFDTDCCFVRCRKQFRWFPVDDGAGAVRFAEALIKKGLHMVFIAHQACGTETAEVEREFFPGEFLAENGGEHLERAVGEFRLIFSGCNAVFVEFRTEYAEVAVIEITGFVADSSPERFDHVQTGEIGGELYILKQVCHDVACQELRLPFRSPRRAAERARAVASGLGSGFALNQLNGGIVGVAELAQSTDPLEHTGFVGVVCMISDGVDDLGCSGGKYVVDPLIAGQAGGAADDFCIGIAGPDRCCSRLDEFAIFRSADTVLPAPGSVRLVPDFIPLEGASIYLRGN